MNEHNEHVGGGHIDQINAANEIARHDAETGRKLLQNLSSVDRTPALTFRNVINATDTFTTLNCIALVLTYTAALMEYSIPTSQISFIIADLGRPELASWLSTASTCATSAILPSMSSLTDVFGRRYALLFGTSLGFTGALVAGFAPTTEIVILGQVRGFSSIPMSFQNTNEAIVRPCPALVSVSPSSLQHPWLKLYLLSLAHCGARFNIVRVICSQWLDLSTRVP
jgi:hypothetical protein